MAILTAFSAFPGGFSVYPADIDVWLDLPAIWLDQKKLSNRALLKNIGDTIGSHIDIDILRSVDSIRQIKTGFQPSTEHEMMTDYLRQVGEVIVSLSEYVLERYSLFPRERAPARKTES